MRKEVSNMKIVKKIVPESKWNIKCPYTMKPTRIVVHNTANDASAQNEIAYMTRNDYKTSFHYAVDDKEVVQGIEENRNAWHAGDGGNGKGNRQGIGIEICYSKSGGSKYTKAEENAVELIVDILKRYNWGIDKVTKHQDYDGKYCPHRILDNGWDKFISKVKAKMAETNKKTEQKANEREGFEVAKTYKNGSTPENVYADTSLTTKIGSLDARETCECLAIVNGRYLVKYKVNGTSNYKCGFVKYSGGVK